MCGGAPTSEINLAMLSTCATAGDREGAEAIARMLAHTGHLSKEQVPVLVQVMGVGPHRPSICGAELHMEAATNDKAQA